MCEVMDTGTGGRGMEEEESGALCASECGLRLYGMRYDSVGVVAQ